VAVLISTVVGFTAPIGFKIECKPIWSQYIEITSVKYGPNITFQNKAMLHDK